MLSRHLICFFFSFHALFWFLAACVWCETTTKNPMQTESDTVADAFLCLRCCSAAWILLCLKAVSSRFLPFFSFFIICCYCWEAKRFGVERHRSSSYNLFSCLLFISFSFHSLFYSLYSLCALFVSLMDRLFLYEKLFFWFYLAKKKIVLCLKANMKSQLKSQLECVVVSLHMRKMRSVKESQSA